MKKFLLLLSTAFLFVANSQAQTLSTESGTGYTGGTTFSTGVAAITFAIQNTNAYAIKITQVDVYWRIAENGHTGSLWYSATSLGGAPTIDNPDWTFIATGSPVSVTASAYYPTITGLSFNIPANTTYRFAVKQSPTGRYSTAGATPNMFTVDGVNLITGDALIGGNVVGYGGNGTTPVSNPRFFTGRVIFEPVPNLPVTLSNLSGNKEVSGNVLRWTTSTEQNNKGFEIERSVDGRNFSNVGFVSSKADNGNSNHLISYSFIDKGTATEYYYRLRQVDLDNKETYSNTIRIRGEKVKVLTISSIYPNPVNEKLNIIIETPSKENLNIVITNIDGKQMIQQNVSVEPGSNSIAIPVKQLLSGNYIVKVISTQQNESSTIRFVKQ